MKNLSANLTLEKNLISGSTPWIVLLKITLTDGNMLYFAANNENVIFQEDEYIAIPFEASLINSNVQGRIPTIKLKVVNITRPIASQLNSLNGGIGSDVKMILINTGHLTEDYQASDLEIDWEVLGCEVTSFFITWELGMANPHNQRFPLYRYVANHCMWQFANGVECPYVIGTGETATCNRTLENCIVHGMEVHFGGFIGMNSDSIRIA